MGVGLVMSLLVITVAVDPVTVAAIGAGGLDPQFVQPTMLSAPKFPAETAMLLTVKGRTANWAGAATVTLAITFQVTCRV